MASRSPDWTDAINAWTTDSAARVSNQRCTPIATANRPTAMTNPAISLRTTPTASPAANRGDYRSFTGAVCERPVPQYGSTTRRAKCAQALGRRCENEDITSYKSVETRTSSLMKSFNQVRSSWLASVSACVMSPKRTVTCGSMFEPPCSSPINNLNRGRIHLPFHEKATAAEPADAASLLSCDDSDSPVSEYRPLGCAALTENHNWRGHDPCPTCNSPHGRTELVRTPIWNGAFYAPTYDKPATSALVNR